MIQRSEILIKGYFLDYEEKELVMIDDNRKLVDILELERFLAHLTFVRFPEPRYPNLYDPVKIFLIL